MPDGARTAWQVMGTWATLIVAAPHDLGRAAGRAESSLAAVERRFSTHIADSEVSRFGLGEVSDPSEQLRHVLAACEWLADVSGGVFTTTSSRGTFDPAGYVKGWAIETAADDILSAGITDFALGVGGDWRCSGSAAGDRPWRIAVVDPHARDRARAVVEVNDGALATSGRYERGDHLVSADPLSGPEPASFSVFGPSAAWADAFATVGLLKGLDGLEWVTGFDGYSAAIVGADGAMLATDEFPLSQSTFPWPDVAHPYSPSSA